jgi:hypothetical protein
MLLLEKCGMDFFIWVNLTTYKEVKKCNFLFELIIQRFFNFIPTMPNMKRLLLLLVFLASLVIASAKGMEGYYLLRGRVLIGNQALANTQIIINDSLVKTDDSGRYEIEIKWISLDHYGSFLWSYRRKEKKLNPEYITFTYQSRMFRIKNNWRQYSKQHVNKAEQIVEFD